MAHDTLCLSVPQEWLLNVYGGSDMASYLVRFVTNLDPIESGDLQIVSEPKPPHFPG